MKTIYPKYFESFKCLASLCPDTCCAGWEIVINEEYQRLYKESSAPSAIEAAEAMYTDDDGDVCLKLNNGRCPMLNDNNLCRLYIDMGESALCDVCRTYPRFNKDFETYIFSGLSLSCPEAARLILSDNLCGKLNVNPILKKKEANKIFDEYKIYTDKIKNGRFFENIPPSKIMLKITNIIIDFEILTDEWLKMCHTLKSHLERVCISKNLQRKRDASFKEASQIKELKNIEVYYLYKYLTEALDSGDTKELLQTVAVSSAIITEFYAMEIMAKGSVSFDKVLRTAQLFSKEIEHSGENLNLIVHQTPRFQWKDRLYNE